MAQGRRSRLRGIAPLALVAACGGSSGTGAAPQVGKALAAAITAADHARAPWRCDDTPPLAAETFANGWQLTDHALTRTTARESRELAVAFVADAGGDTPSTLAALGRLRARLDAIPVDLVITLGGMGGSEREISATLAVLADRAPWPVVALPGDLEAMPAQVAALAGLRKRGNVVLDGRLVRWIETPGATIGTLPGAGAAARLVAGDDGCAWTAEAVTQMYGELAKRPGIRIAALAEPPREIVDGEPTGVLELAPSATHAIDVVVHAPNRPAPSPERTGTRNSARVTLSPGTSDASPRLPETTRPSAGILVIRGESWSWRSLVDR